MLIGADPLLVICKHAEAIAHGAIPGPTASPQFPSGSSVRMSTPRMAGIGGGVKAPGGVNPDAGTPGKSPGTGSPVPDSRSATMLISNAVAAPKLAGVLDDANNFAKQNHGLFILGGAGLAAMNTVRSQAADKERDRQLQLAMMMPRQASYGYLPPQPIVKAPGVTAVAKDYLDGLGQFVNKQLHENELPTQRPMDPQVSAPATRPHIQE